MCRIYNMVFKNVFICVNNTKEKIEEKKLK